MPVLVEPTIELRDSYLDAWAEFAAEGRGTPDDHSALGFEAGRFAERWNSVEGFSDFVDYLIASGDPEVPPADGWVKQTTFWFVDGDRYLGSIRVRHSLNEMLLEEGGHIGYDVRPTARRRGYATQMLAGVLPFAHSLAISSALVTCDTENVASRRVIERCGGQYEDTRNGKMRFWVTTAA